MCSKPGNLSQYYCTLHHFRLTTTELKRKNCQEKQCRSLAYWNDQKLLYRKGQRKRKQLPNHDIGKAWNPGKRK